MTDYLDWQSEITLQQVFAAQPALSYPSLWQDNDDDASHKLIYLTNLKDEGRNILMIKTIDQNECITPAPFNLHTRINEYGGKPYWLMGNDVYFTNQADQCLYHQKLGDRVSFPERVSCLPTLNTIYRYSDVVRFNDSKLLAIVEQQDLNDHSSQSYIAVIDITKKECAPVVLESGADFYSNLVIDDIGEKIAWVQWDHPSMPWDNTECWVATLDTAETNTILTHKHRLALDPSASVCQLCFANNGRLFFSSDFAMLGNPDSSGWQNRNHWNRNYWNVYCYDWHDHKIHAVTNLDVEFGYPHWQYGDCRIVRYDSNTLLAIGSDPNGDHLYAIHQDTLDVNCITPWHGQPHGTLQSLSSDFANDHHDRTAGGNAVMVRSPVDQDPYVTSVHGPAFDCSVLSESKNRLSAVSLAQHTEFKTTDGESAYGFYYPPVNERYQNESDENLGPPPLIVMVHGGPTARAYGHFDIQKQFWTSRGFALFDVNHRGSSGYGRCFRDALLGQWGELDIRDVVDGIHTLINAGMADRDRICIRGKSAGGYAVLRALTEYPELFRAGACYYGIGNLATLAESTHKFEKHYTDRLIGEDYHPDSVNDSTSLYQLRSPIHKLQKLQSAMIIFQGLQDKVVPPAIAQEIIDVLKTANIEHSYVEYPDEGHGFRQVANNIDALGKELAFYRRILSSEL